jgi:hypothetical protein
MLHNTKGQMRHANLVVRHDIGLNELTTALLDPVGNIG